jgi:hypothetical protein
VPRPSSLDPGHSKWGTPPLQDSAEGGVTWLSRKLSHKSGDNDPSRL